MYSCFMSVSYAILGMLDVKPSYGYDLKKFYDSFFGQTKALAYGQVYGTLSRLNRDGSIEETTDDDEKSGGPDRIRYQITKTGEQELNGWLQKMEEPSSEIQPTLYMKTVLSILIGGETADYLDSQRDYHLDKMRELTKRKMNSPISDKLVIDHKLMHIEADIKWIDLTVSRLGALKKEIKDGYNNISC